MTASSVTSHAIAAVVGTLQLLRDVVADLPKDVYSSEVAGACPASIGRQVRHCSDHVRLFVEGVASGEIDYDDRVRGTDLEVNPAAAAAELEQLCAALSAGPFDADQELRIRSVTNPAGQRVTTRSSVGRELVYLQCHTVHHAAMIRGVLEAAGVAVPAQLGFAPSTTAHSDSAR